MLPLLLLKGRAEKGEDEEDEEDEEEETACDKKELVSSRQLADTIAGLMILQLLING